MQSQARKRWPSSSAARAGSVVVAASVSADGEADGAAPSRFKILEMELPDAFEAAGEAPAKEEHQNEKAVDEAVSRGRWKRIPPFMDPAARKGP